MESDIPPIEQLSDELYYLSIEKKSISRCNLGIGTYYYVWVYDVRWGVEWNFARITELIERNGAWEVHLWIEYQYGVIGWHTEPEHRSCILLSDQVAILGHDDPVPEGEEPNRVVRFYPV